MSPTASTPANAGGSSRAAAGPGTQGGSASDGGGARRRFSASQLGVLALVVLVVVAIFSTAARRPSDDIMYSPYNTRPYGMQALARLLEDEGVSVSKVASLDALLTQAEKERWWAHQRPTVAVLHSTHLSVEERQRIAESGADVTLLGADYDSAEGFVPALALSSEPAADPLGTYPAQGELSELLSSKALAAEDAPTLLPCTDEDAIAAEQMSLLVTALSVFEDKLPQASACFPMPITKAGQEAVGYGYVTAPLGFKATLRVLPDANAFTNEHLATQGNAALAIRALGHNGRVLWFDATQQESETLWQTPTWPPLLPLFLVQGLACVLILALIKGRRFGPFVKDERPGFVPASETVRGRGTLYHHSGSRDHAAALLRHASAARLRRRLRLGAQASTETFLERLSARTGRSVAELREIYTGPPPTDDAALTTLIQNLDRIESEVHPS